MKFGFIGAGNIGFSLGKYFAVHNLDVVGFYSERKEDAVEATKFVGGATYDTIEDLVADSDVLFITVPDDSIADVWNQVKASQFADKIICHTSGVLTSEVFSGIDDHHSFGYSIHPLFAVNDKFSSYKELSNVYFTIEGNNEKLDVMSDLFLCLGNKVAIISAKDKALYHAAATMASNLVVGLVDSAEEVILHEALAPILKGNMEHIINDGTEKALTGPIERGDVQTVRKHLDVLEGDMREQYIAVSKQVVKVAKRKNKDKDYTEIEKELFK